MIRTPFRPLVRAFVRSGFLWWVYDRLDDVRDAIVPLAQWCSIQRAYLISREAGLRKEDQINLKRALEFMHEAGVDSCISKPMMSGEYFGTVRPDDPIEASVYDWLVTMRRGPSRWVQ